MRTISGPLWRCATPRNLTAASMFGSVQAPTQTSPHPKDIPNTHNTLPVVWPCCGWSAFMSSALAWARQVRAGVLAPPPSTYRSPQRARAAAPTTQPAGTIRPPLAAGNWYSRLPSRSGASGGGHTNEGSRQGGCVRCVSSACAAGRADVCSPWPTCPSLCCTIPTTLKPAHVGMGPMPRGPAPRPSHSAWLFPGGPPRACRGLPVSACSSPHPPTIAQKLIHLTVLHGRIMQQVSLIQHNEA